MLLAASVGTSTAAVGAPVVEANLEQAAHLALDGPVGDVAVVGTTVVVASDACPATAVVVDARDPKRPKVAARIALPPGTSAGDLDATALETPVFSGDVVAVALTASPCGSTAAVAGGAAYYDVTDPAAPRPLGRTSPCTGCGAATPSISLAQRADGRAAAVRADGSDSVSIDDVTDATRPVTVGRWTAPAAEPATCRPVGPVSGVALYDDGREVVVALAGGRVFDLDLVDMAAPFGEGTPPQQPGGASTFAAALPVAQRTLAVVAEERGGDACPGDPGLRLLEVGGGATPVEVAPVRFTTPAAPGRIVASGELAYVAWHGDGVRVVDVGGVKGVAVAQFKPAVLDVDVVGVALLPEHVVVSDRTSGLYVLRRPDEGGPRSTFWTQLVGLVPYLLFAAVLAAFFVVPRLMAGRAPLGSGVPDPVPEPARRRRRA